MAAQTEPLACVLNGINKIKPNPSNRILLYGAGPIGLTFVRVLKMYGVTDLIVAEMSPERKDFALKCGADFVLDPSKVDLKKELIRIWGNLPDIVIDAVGAGSIMESSLELLKCRGSYLIFGQDSNAISKIKPAIITRNELIIMGSYIADHTFPLAVRYLGNDNLGIDRLVSHKIELKDILKGIELIKSKAASRIIIFPNGIIE